MELSRPHRHSRRYPAGDLDRVGGLNGNGGSPGIRQSRPRVSKVYAPERYSAGVPPCQFAGALTECLEVRGSANTGFSAQAVYSRAVPRHQSAGALGEYLQPSDLADTRIFGRARTRALATRSGECRQASRAIPGFAVGQRLIESPVLAAAVTRCGYKTAEPWFAGRRVERRTQCRQSEGGSCKEGPGRHPAPDTQPSAPTQRPVPRARIKPTRWAECHRR